MLTTSPTAHQEDREHHADHAECSPRIVDVLARVAPTDRGRWMTRTLAAGVRDAVDLVHARAEARALRGDATEVTTATMIDDHGDHDGDDADDDPDLRRRVRVAGRLRLAVRDDAQDEADDGRR